MAEERGTKLQSRNEPPPKAVDINPHFVSLRNFQDLRTITHMLKNFTPISRWQLSNSMAHQELQKFSSRLFATLLSFSASSPAVPNVPPTNGISSEIVSRFVNGAAAGIPAYRRQESDSIPPDVPPARVGCDSSNISELSLHIGFKESIGHSSRKILCIWDVDDTLVASGAAGVRQNLVFSKGEFLSLFNSLRSGARHLLLSKGTIDDVFSSSTGQLGFLERFFYDSSREHENSAGHSSRGIFTCASTKKRTEDIATSFEKGVKLIRLCSICTDAENDDEERFLSDANSSPTLQDSSGRPIRWLVLRSSIWGIAISPVGGFAIPSRHTIFLDSKAFKKMDVVWSLAASGHWDTVFFVDNNLSEIGLVRHGLRMADVQSMRKRHSMDRFFQSDFLLLTGSAKLREMNRLHGRDVTQPPSASRDLCSDDSQREKSTPEVAAELRSASCTHHTPAVATVSAGVLLPSEFLDSTPSQSCCRISAGVPAPTSAMGNVDKVKRVDLVLAHLHLESSAYRRILQGSRTQILRRGTTFASCTGQPTFTGDSSLTDEEYETLMTLFCCEETSFYQFMDEDMRLNGYIDVRMAQKNFWCPNARYVHISMRPRVMCIYHMRNYYRPLCANVVQGVISPLAVSSCKDSVLATVRNEARRLCLELIYQLSLIDPYFSGELAIDLFHIYISEGSLKKLLVENLRRSIKRMMGNMKEASGKATK